MKLEILNGRTPILEGWEFERKGKEGSNGDEDITGQKVADLWEVRAFFHSL